MIAIVTFWNCGTMISDDVQQSVAIGKKVYVEDNSSALFGHNNLICTAKFKDSKLEDIRPVATTFANVTAVAIQGDFLYVLTKEGLCRFTLSSMNGTDTNPVPEPVVGGDLGSADRFEIYEDNIYFLDENKLRSIPANGGSASDIKDKVIDYEVTDNGIYYVEKDGDLHLLSSDLKKDKEVGKLPKGVKFTLNGRNLYYKNEDIIEYYPLNKKTGSDSGNKKNASEKAIPWASGENILYLDKHNECHIITASGELDVCKTNAYPDKAEGCIFENNLIAVSEKENQLQVFDLEKGEYKTYDLKTELAKAASKPIGTNVSQADGFDIAKGHELKDQDEEYAKLVFNGFSLTLPNNKKWGWEQTDSDTVRIFLHSAQKDGFGGVLVTVKAYNMNDKSYEALQNSRVAGVNKSINKVFVVSYPTDTQWNNKDSEQTADYKELESHLQKISEGADESPLQVNDD